MWQPAEYSVLRRNTVKSWKLRNYELRRGVAIGVGKIVSMMVMMVVMMMLTAKPLSRLLSTVPDRQSKRLVHLASRLFQTPQRHEQRPDAFTNKPFIPRWINPFILEFV
jgi:hypothetical protein